MNYETQCINISQSLKFQATIIACTHKIDQTANSHQIANRKEKNPSKKARIFSRKEIKEEAFQLFFSLSFRFGFDIAASFLINLDFAAGKTRKIGLI